MCKITLQAGGTFWFDHPASPPARWIFQGQPFEIPAEDFPAFALVGRELLSGKLTEDKPKTLAEKILTAVSDSFAAVKEKIVQDKWPCPHCGQVFKAEKGLAIHLRNAHPETLERKAEQSADDPAEQSADDPAEQSADDQAEQSADDPAEQSADDQAEQSADDQAEQSADDQAAFPCAQCDRSFSTKRGLEIHIGHIHEDHHAKE